MTTTSNRKILVFDNYDSFTYNLVHILHQLGEKNVTIQRNDQITIEQIAPFDKIILSPGYGLPSNSGILLDLIKTYAPTKSILGVCLGMQAIAEVFGGKLYNLPSVYHGISTPIKLIEKDVLFDDLPQEEIVVGRYHSWAVERETLPNQLIPTAIDEKGVVMALKHNQYDVRGVQFHPESVMTTLGKKMIKNWLSNSSK